MYFHHAFGHSEKLILQSRNISVAEWSDAFYCALPYGDRLCCVSANKSDTSDNCITYTQLVTSRVLPLVSFIVQICLIRELFTLSGNYSRVVVYALWVTSTLIFIGITISIHWNSCYHAYTSLFLFLTGGSLSLFSMHNAIIVNDHLISLTKRNQVVVVHDRPISSMNRNEVVVGHQSKTDNKGNTPWQELI